MLAFHKRPFLLLALAALISLAGARPARASAELRKELTEVAKGIKQLLDGRGEQTIAVGQFTGPPNYPTSSGPGIAEILTEELQKLGVTVKARAKLGVKGEYLVTEVADPNDVTGKYLAVRLKGTVEDGFGKVINDFTFERTVKGEEAVVQLLGTPVELPPDDLPKDRDRKIRESYAGPKANIAGSRVNAGPGGKFALEILVDGKPRAARDDDGLAFVKIARGETYAVKLINDSDLEMAVRLTIDGLSWFAFSELRHKDGPHKGEPLFSVVYVKPHGSVVIKGWHRTNEVSDSFQVTEYAKSAAATLSHTANLGTITASFAASWPENADPPKDEAPKPRGNPADATGFGPRVEAKYTAVKRNIGVIRASVSVRYTK
jgi:hypothetical protein